MGADDVDERAAGLDDPRERIAARFCRTEVQERAGRHIEFATRPGMAAGMLKRVRQAGARVAWATVDEVSGGDYRVRSWLRRVKQPCALGARSNSKE